MSYFITQTVYIEVVSNSISGTFLAFVTILIAADIFRRRQVTMDNILGGLCVYIMIGVLWTIMYINLVMLDPHAFDYGIHGANPDFVQQFYLLNYFSFITLLTIGFGDIIPLSIMAQILTYIEGLIGQFYLVFFMASLVGMYVSRKGNQ